MKTIQILLMTVLASVAFGQDENAVLGVIVGESGFECGKDCAIGANGSAVYGDGHGNYITSKGFAYESKGDYVASNSTYVTETNEWFYGTKAAIKAGDAYMGSTSTFVGTSRSVSLRKP